MRYRTWPRHTLPSEILCVAGRSTCLRPFSRLLPRHKRRPAAARSFWRITFDGVSATEFSLESLRAAIAYAPQEPELFDVPAIKHIRCGRLDASRAEVERAAALAGAHDFIQSLLPEGCETMVGEGGAPLSGGQRQRLDLAWELLKGAPILILDEPTSQPDADAEREFRAALMHFHKETDRTIVIVTHRLSTAEVAEKVAVPRNGQVVKADTRRESRHSSGEDCTFVPAKADNMLEVRPKWARRFA